MAMWDCLLVRKEIVTRLRRYCLEARGAIARDYSRTSSASRTREAGKTYRRSRPIAQRPITTIIAIATIAHSNPVHHL